MSLLRRILTPFRVMIILNDGTVNSAWGPVSWRYFAETCTPPLAIAIGSSPSLHVRALDRNGRGISLKKVEFSPCAIKRWSDVEAKGGFLEDIQVFLPARQVLLERGSLPHVYFSMGSFVEPLEQRPASYNQFQVVISDPWQKVSRGGFVRRFEDCLLGRAGVVAAYVSRVRILSLNQLEAVITERFVYSGILRTDIPEVGRMKGRWENVPVPCPPSASVPLLGVR